MCFGSLFKSRIETAGERSKENAKGRFNDVVQDMRLEDAELARAKSEARSKVEERLAKLEKQERESKSCAKPSS